MSRPCFRNSLIIMASVILLGAPANAAQTEKSTQEPIVITSNRMEAEKLGDKITFIGNVLLKKEGMTLTSDTMIVFYDTDSKDVREIDASGNVVVRKEGRVALSNRAFYYNKEEKIVLTGEARIIENENEIAGERITLFLSDDRSIVEGGKVLLYQNKLKKSLDKSSEGKKLE